jgi:uncharacterized beta-barrel protein YwiB (DUF1934 family)
MAESRKVNIRIVSRAGDETIEQQIEGSLYIKNGHAYIRYEEPFERMGRTVTLVKIDPGEIKIIRRGDIASEQLFAIGLRTSGVYETPQSVLQLSMFTHRIDARLQSGIGAVEWSYDLYVAGELAGTYALQIEIQEAS